MSTRFDSRESPLKRSFTENLTKGGKRKPNGSGAKRKERMRFLFIETSTEGYKKILRTHNISASNSERVLLPADLGMIKRKLNNICPHGFKQFSFLGENTPLR